MHAIRKKDNELQISIAGLFRMLWKKRKAVLSGAIAGGLLTFLVVQFLIAPKYEAYITLYVNNFSTEDTSKSISTNDLTASAKLVDTYAAIISSNAVLKRVVKDINTEYTPNELREKITVSAINNTEVFRIIVEDRNPETAAEIANAIAEVSPDKITDIVEGSSVKIIDKAEIPTESSSASAVKMMLVGLILGFLLSAAGIAVYDFWNQEIETVLDFENMSYPVLGVIPELSMKYKNDGYGSVK